MSQQARRPMGRMYPGSENNRSRLEVGVMLPVAVLVNDGFWQMAMR